MSPNTYSLLDDAGGRFAIDAVTGSVGVANGLLLDHESATQHSITVRALSSDGSSSVITLQISVVNVNEAPSGSDQTATGLEDQPLVLNGSQFGFSDVDAGDQLAAVRIDSLPAGGQLLLNGGPVVAGQLVSSAAIMAGQLAWLPALNGFGNGLDQLQFTVMDSGGLLATSPSLLVFNILPVNDAPTAFNASVSVAEDSSTTGQATGVDVDNPSLEWSWSLVTGSSQGGNVVLQSDGSFLYTPAANFNGTDSFQVRLNDGQGGTSVATITVNVTPVNDQPVAMTDLFAMVQGTSLSDFAGVLVNDADPDGDPLVAMLLQGPAHGTLTIQSNGSFVYVPTAGYFGPDSFLYLVSDGQISSAPALVSIEVFGGPGPIGGGGDPGDDDPADETGEDTDDSDDDGSTESETGSGSGGDGEFAGGTPAVMRELLERIARQGDGADSLARIAGNLKNLVTLRKLQGLAQSTAASIDEAGLLALAEWLADAGRRGDGAASQLEIPVWKGGPRLVISLDRLWEQIGAISRAADPEALLFSASPLAMGAGGVTMAAAVSYLLWYLRGGVLMATFLSQIPTWRMIDPLPVLESFNDRKREVKDDMQSFFGQ